MIEKFYAYYKSPIGLMEIIGTESVIYSINFVEEKVLSSSSHAYVEEAAKQIDEYFQKERKLFDLVLDYRGTPFQKQVWTELLTIPFGYTASYQEIAKGIDNPKAVRAVGAANGRNPISIIVPCHRIVGSDGSLTGYAGGLWRKSWLLQHEGSRLL